MTSLEMEINENLVYENMI